MWIGFSLAFCVGLPVCFYTHDISKTDEAIMTSIQSMVCRCRLSLFGHVARTPDYVPAKADRGGRPAITWLHQICSDIACVLETSSTVLRIGSCGERMLRPPRPCIDDNDGHIHGCCVVMQELYGWSMDAIVKEIGLKNNCMLLFYAVLHLDC